MPALVVLTGLGKKIVTVLRKKSYIQGKCSNERIPKLALHDQQGK